MAAGWHEGTIGIPTKDGGMKVAHYWVKAFEEPSEEYGINGGRISKLSIKIGGEWKANYDRGWDMEPEKIDGIVASIMAVDRAVRNQGDSGSVYDERGIIVF